MSKLFQRQLQWEHVVLALVVYLHGFTLMQGLTCCYTASELLPTSMATGDTAAARHLLQHPDHVPTGTAVTELFSLTCAYPFFILQGNRVVAVYSVMTLFQPFLLLSSFYNHRSCSDKVTAAPFTA